MKLTKKNSAPFAWIILLGLTSGTLVWELLERILSLVGVDFTLTAGPVGFDIGVLSVFLTVNPGSILGIAGGIVLFKRL